MYSSNSLVTWDRNGSRSNSMPAWQVLGTL